MDGPALPVLVHGNVAGNGDSISALVLDDVSGEGGLSLLCRERGVDRQADEVVTVTAAGAKRKGAAEARRRSWSWGGNESEF